MKNWLVCAVAFAVCFWAKPAAAQLTRGEFRLTLDTDIISVGNVNLEVPGGGDSDTLVFGLGPSQLGASRVTGPTTPLGLGFGWVLTPKIVLGFRLGLGYDLVKYEGGNEAHALAFSLQPGIEFVPIGRHAKLFIAARPIFQVNYMDFPTFETTTLLGGFSFGIGTYIFPMPSVSVDLGFFFEGRFGSMENADEVKLDVQDLRGVIRLGVSMWR